MKAYAQLAGMMGVSYLVALFLSGPLLRRLSERGLNFLNYRKEAIPVGSGLIITAAGSLSVIAGAAVSFFFVEGWRTLLMDSSPAARFFYPAGFLLPLLVTALGFNDDVRGDAGARGFRGHLKALLSGRITSGLMKAAGGFLLAFVWAAAYEWWSGGKAGPSLLLLSLLNAFLIALAMNAINLFDLRPGRAVKVTLLAVIPCLYVLTPLTVYVLAAWLPAVLHVFGLDLRREAMLGDAGSNLLGALAGVLLVLSFGWPGRLAALAVFLGLNLLSEFRSFTSIIESNRYLRAFDDLGR